MIIIGPSGELEYQFYGTDTVHAAQNTQDSVFTILSSFVYSYYTIIDVPESGIFDLYLEFNNPSGSITIPLSGYFVYNETEDEILEMEPEVFEAAQEQPDPATNLDVTSVSSDGGGLEWEASISTNIDFYRLYISTTDGGPYTLHEDNIFGLSTLVSGLSADTYYFVVRAVNIGGYESQNSNQEQIVVIGGP